MNSNNENVPFKSKQRLRQEMIQTIQHTLHNNQKLYASIRIFKSEFPFLTIAYDAFNTESEKD